MAKVILATWIGLANNGGRVKIWTLEGSSHGRQQEKVEAHDSSYLCFRIFRIWLLFLQRFDDWTHGWKGMDSWPPGFGLGSRRWWNGLDWAWRLLLQDVHRIIFQHHMQCSQCIRINNT